MTSDAAAKAGVNWKKLTWIPKLLLTAGAFYLIAGQIDLEQMQHMLREQSIMLVLATGALALVQILIGGFRWYFILGRLDAALETVLSRARALRVFYISIFFNTCLPGTVGGDVVRVFLAKGQGVALPLAINSVVIDRIVTLLALVVMMFFSLPYVGAKLGISPWVVLPVMTVGTVAGIWLLVNLHRLPKKLRETKVGELFAHLAEHVRQVFFRPKTLVISCCLALVSHTIYFMEAWVMAKSLHIDITLMHMMLYMPLVMFISILPISIGGWGVREAGMVGLLAFSGVPAESAVMVSVQMALITILILLPGGVMWLLQRKATPVTEMAT